jgi:hypothetical protein
MSGFCRASGAGGHCRQASALRTTSAIDAESEQTGGDEEQTERAEGGDAVRKRGNGIQFAFNPDVGDAGVDAHGFRSAADD